MKLYVGGRPTFFYVFFSNFKKHDFLRFLSCCTRFLEQWYGLLSPSVTLNCLHQSLLLSTLVYLRYIHVHLQYRSTRSTSVLITFTSQHPALQTDNHASTPPHRFLQAGCLSCRAANSVKALKQQLDVIVRR